MFHHSKAENPSFVISGIYFYSFETLGYLISKGVLLDIFAEMSFRLSFLHLRRTSYGGWSFYLNVNGNFAC